MLDFWPAKKSYLDFWLLTFALTEDEDQSTGYIGVPPPCYWNTNTNERLLHFDKSGGWTINLEEFVNKNDTTNPIIAAHFVIRFPSVWSSLLTVNIAAFGTLVSFWNVILQDENLIANLCKTTHFFSPSSRRNDSNAAGAFIGNVQYHNRIQNRGTIPQSIVHTGMSCDTYCDEISRLKVMQARPLVFYRGTTYCLHSKLHS